MPQGDAKKAAARSAFERVVERIVFGPDGCWLWPGATAGPKSHLYGAVGTGSRTDGTRRNAATHRVVWEALVGPIRGELDHLCRVTLCCNPMHLEDVTHQENMRRMVVSEAGRAVRSATWKAINAQRWAA